MRTMLIEPVTAASIASAKRAQAEGRDEFTKQTGATITPDGRIVVPPAPRQERTS